MSILKCQSLIKHLEFYCFGTRNKIEKNNHCKQLRKGKNEAVLGFTIYLFLKSAPNK